MGKAENAETIGVHCSKAVIHHIAARADALGIKKSRFAAMIFEKWAADGYPAVSLPDSHMREGVIQKVRDEISRELNERGRQLAQEKKLRRAEKAVGGAIETNKGPFPLAVPKESKLRTRGSPPESRFGAA